VAESSEREDERWEVKEKQGIIIIFHTTTLVLRHMWIFAGKQTFLQC